MSYPSQYITTLIGLSVGAERLVEIIKSNFSYLDDKKAGAAPEKRRHRSLQWLGLAAGLTTAWLARSALPTGNPGDLVAPWIPYGLLAGCGSGFWNSILTYSLNLKDLKGAEADAAKRPATN